MTLLSNLFKNEKEQPSLYVRIATSYWHDKRGVHKKQSITTLKRKSRGAYDILVEDCELEGAAEVFSRITNLNDIKDGVYKVIACNEWVDYETGYIDDYDYKLVEANDES